jgi:hypothetical protein
MVGDRLFLAVGIIAFAEIDIAEDLVCFTNLSTVISIAIYIVPQAMTYSLESFVRGLVARILIYCSQTNRRLGYFGDKYQGE